MLLDINNLVIQWGLATPKQTTTYPIAFKTFVTTPISSWAYVSGSARGTEVVSYSLVNFVVRESANGQVTKEKSIIWYVIGN